MAVLLICFTVIVIVFFVQWIFRDRSLHTFGQSLPGPKSLIILGNVLSFVFKNDNEKFKLIAKWHLKYQEHNLWRMWIGPSLWIFVNKPELVEKLLESSQCNEKFLFNDFLQLETNSCSWKTHRETLKNSFCDAAVNSHIANYIESVIKAMNFLSSKLDKHDEFDVFEFTQQCSFLLICRTLLGIDVNYADIDKKLFVALKEFTEVKSARRRNPILHPEPVYKLTRMYYKEKKSVKRIKSYIDQAIREKKQHIKGGSGPEPTTSFSHDKLDEELGENINLFSDSNSSILDEIISRNDLRKLSDEDIRNQVFIAMATGYETIAVQSAYLILLLAMHPSVQDKLVEEIEANVFEQNTIDCDILDKLSFMENVINETMRLFPVVPFSCRLLLEDLMLGDVSVPKGVTLFVSFYSLHRRPDVWGEQSHSFNPDNFTADNVRDRHKMSFLPFSYGDRNCVGSRYSILSIKTMLIKLLTNYKFSTSLSMDDITLSADIILRMSTKNVINIQPRQRGK